MTQLLAKISIYRDDGTVLFEIIFPADRDNSYRVPSEHEIFLDDTTLWTGFDLIPKLKKTR